MPAIKIFCNLTTAPLASDDMHIVCLILGLYRIIQFICLLPLIIYHYIITLNGRYMIINGIPHWCAQYENVSFEPGSTVPILKGFFEIEYAEDPFIELFLTPAVAFFCIDVAWLIMVWHSASIGTPTEPMRRDVYIRNLMKIKIFFINLYPIALIGTALYYVHAIRANNFGCGEEGLATGMTPDSGGYYGLFCCLLFTYAIELLVWPSMIMNKIVRALQFRRNRVSSKAARFEVQLGCILKLLSCCCKGKIGVLKSHGSNLSANRELQDFASNVMCLLNNQTKLGLVLSDMYFGFRMLSRVQGERKVEAIKKLAKKSSLFKEKVNGVDKDSGQKSILKFSDHEETDETTQGDANPEKELHRKRSSIMVLQTTDDDTDNYEVCEREILHESIKSDQTLMSKAPLYAEYARCAYVAYLNCVLTEFEGEVHTDSEEDDFFRRAIVTKEECTGLRRDLDTLFDNTTFQLTTIGLGHANLCYSNFVNGIAPTPYSILLDHEEQSVVIAIRGTLSIEDIVVDTQFVPETLEEVGKVCGFSGEGHFCHKGFLIRSKWMYNDIKKTQVLKTLYSELSPYKDYSLVVCGHSLGAGCASILSLMLRPSFPSLRCFAYEPPGCVFDNEMSKECASFITSFVRHDDLVPRLSYHNFEVLREEFFLAFQRIKVPKIMLYSHLQVPVEDRNLPAHNAQVLRPQEDIPTDTIFNKQLEKFRAERSEKNRDKSMEQLYIPGSIVHLVDTSNTENRETYIPYWANRAEFNQVEISKRMYSDHDIHSLVDILKGIKLGGTHTESQLDFYNMSQIFVDEGDTPDSDIQLFACCSNPYGKLPWLVVLLAVTANALSSAATADCNFVSTSFFYEPVNATINMTFGIYQYEILDCNNSTGDCSDESQCVPYPPNFPFSAHMNAGRAFAALSSLLGAIAVLMILLSTCFIITQRTWMIITILLVLVTLFESLVFIIKTEYSWCSEPDIHCSVGEDAISLIVSCCLWFLTAIGTSYLARVGKKTDEE